MVDAADPPRGGPKSDGVHTWDAVTLRTFLALSSESEDRLYGLWVLLATTGMRRNEALGLRWDDLDMDPGRLRVVRTITQVRAKVAIGEPKTTSGRRSVALDPATVVALREHRKAMLKERLTLHGLRHTWATLALEQGIHPRVVQERLGHSTVAITLGIYSHVAPRLHDEAASVIAELLL